MGKQLERRAFVGHAVACAALLCTACATHETEVPTERKQAYKKTAPKSNAGVDVVENPTPRSRVDEILPSMSLDQKVSQLIMPAIRYWADTVDGVTDLAAVPSLALALRRHQYCGVILFGKNIVDAEQTTRLIADLQANNAQGIEDSSQCVPYFVAADQEGGTVARLNMGTRGTGSMAIAASGEQAESNARATGRLFGEELAALGINVDLGPCVDIISDLTDMGMSTRVFSDDASVVGMLGNAFAEGLSEQGVVACFKHFPGAGDGSDYPTAINISLEELKRKGIRAYASVIDAGAEMIMTAATTFPAFDEEHVLADGITTGCYPATMSKRIVTDMLRDELAYDGVVITDALEMEQFFQEPLTGASILPGEKYSVELAVAIACKCLEAGCDILLIPTDLSSDYSADWYDQYVAGLVALVENGELSEARIDDSVRRILSLKERYGVLDLNPLGMDILAASTHARKTVGSEEHHSIERAIAEQAVTLIKNDGVLPISLDGNATVIVGRTQADTIPITYALNELVQKGLLDSTALVRNLTTGAVTGSDMSDTNITIGCYYDANTGASAYSDMLSEAIEQASYVVCLSAVSAGFDAIQDYSVQIQGVKRAMSDAQASGAKFVLLSDNIPVDTARFESTDAIVCAYLSSGFDIDPTTGSGSENMRAINANVPAALRAIFGMGDMPGILPINIPELIQGDDGLWRYSEGLAYERGYHVQ